MDWIILIAVTVLSVIAGYRKGALRMTLRMISFIAAYVVAWKLTPTLAQWFIDNNKLQGVIVYPAAGFSLFFGTSIVLNIFCAFLYWLIPTTAKEGGKSIGAILGGLFGLLFALLCVWTVGVVQNAVIQRQQASQPNTPTRPIVTSPIRKLASQIISTSTQAVLGNENSTAKITSQVLSDPSSVSQELNYLSRQPDIRELFINANNYRAMVNGTPADIMQLPSFQNLMSDQQAMTFLSQAGLTGNTPKEKQLALATNFSTYAKNMEQIKNTAEYRDLITDPDIVAKLNQRDYIALLTNEKVRLLTEMLAHGSSAISAHSAAKNINSDTSQNNTFPNEHLKQKVYRWKDKNGGVHYSSNIPTPDEVDGEVVEIKQ